MFLFCFLGRFYQAERWSVNIFLIQQCRPLFFLVSFLSLAGTCWPFLILSFYISSLEFVLYVNSLQKATQTHTAGSIQNCGTQCNMGSFSLAVFLSPFPFSTPQALEATLESVSLFELTPFFSFLYLSTVWTILPTLGGRVCFFSFFLWMSITTLGLWRLSMLRHLQISFITTCNTLTAKDVREPVAVKGCGLLSLVGYLVRYDSKSPIVSLHMFC